MQVVVEYDQTIIMLLMQTFSMASIITSLRHCQFGIEIFDKLILIMKNWPNNPRFGCTNVELKSIEEYI
jgi:hypothetical protein